MKKDNKMKYFLIIFLCFMALSCSTVTEKKVINISGSETMYYLTIRLASEYMKINPGIVINVTSGGSSSGFDDLLSNKADICMSSRVILPNEIKKLADNFASVGFSYLIAKDALCIFVNNSNPVDDLTIEQLREIFSCRIVSWKNYGGKNLDIKTIVRTPQSGTYEYFKSHILNDDNFCKNALHINSPKNILKEIIKDESAIAFGGIGNLEGVKILKVNGIELSENTIHNESYPIIRYLYFYTKREVKSDIKDFIEWVMSSSGQKIIDESGYISIWK